MFRPLAGFFLLVSASPLIASPTRFAVPAGTVGEAARAIGRQAGINIAVPDHALAGRRAVAVHGEMEPAAALARIASGAGLVVRSAGPGSFLLLSTPRPVTKIPVPARGPVARRVTEISVLPAQPIAQDITVTASKRDTPSLRFAGLWTRIGAEQLAGWGPVGSDAIEARVAGFSTTHLGAGRNKLFIRGIADSSFSGPTQSPVAQYVGDVRTGYSGPDPDLRLVDMSAIEVLEGPQGTLYGAGAIGGILLLKPTSPVVGETSGWVGLGASATQHGAPGHDQSLVLNAAPSSTSAIRLVGYRASEGGYIDNITTGRRDINRVTTDGLRLAGRVEVTPDWTIDVTGATQRIRGDDSQYADLAAPPLSRLSTVAQPFNSDFSMASVVVGKSSGTVRLRSVIGLTNQHLSENFDAASDIWKRLHQSSHATALSSETRIWRPMRDGYSWLVGVSLLSHRYDIARDVSNDTATADLAGVTNERTEATVYTEAGAKLPGPFEFTAGGRLTWSALTGWGRHLLPVPIAAERAVGRARRIEHRFLPSLSVLARPTQKLTLFARVQKGFRPGGLAVADDQVRYFRSDRIVTAEGGLRYGTPRRDPVDVQAGISFSRWSDIQADYIDGRGLPSTANIGDGRVRTVTINVGAQLARGFRAEAGVAWNDGKITRPDESFAKLAAGAALVGNMRIPNIARVVARGGIDWTHQLGGAQSVVASAYLRYVGHSRLGVGPSLGRSQGQYVDSGMSVRLTDRRRSVSLSATNLADEVGNRFSLGTPISAGLDQVTPLRPRSIRLGFETSF